jgi:DNA-binding response OmpR family regulator
MQKTIVNEVAELLKEAMSRGHLVVIRASPPSHVDARTPLLLTLNKLFGLSPAEGRTLLELMQHQHVGRVALHAAMSTEGTPMSKPRTIDVVVCKLRRKLVPHGIEIGTVYRLGYVLDAKSRDRLRELLETA